MNNETKTWINTLLEYGPNGELLRQEGYWHIGPLTQAAAGEDVADEIANAETPPTDVIEEVPGDLNPLDDMFGFDEGVAEVMAHDPFSGNMKLDEAVDETGGSVEQGDEVGGDEPATVITGDREAEEVAAEVKPEDEEAPAAASTPASVTELTEEQAEINLLKQQLGEAKRASAATPPSQTKQEELDAARVGEGEQTIPSYAVDIPPDMLALLTKGADPEDVPALAQGFKQLVDGIGRMIHVVQAGEVANRIKDLRVQMASQNVQDNAQLAEQQRVTNDFYGAFPKLNNPALKSMVSDVSRKVFAETGAQNWSPELRDLIGARVTNILRASVGGNGGTEEGDASTASNPKGGGNPKPAKQLKGGARPGTPNKNSGQGVLEDTIFGA